MPRTDRAERVVNAPVDRVFHALVDRAALEAWLPPRGMTARFESFDPTPGGSYRVVLTYADPTDARGKSSADSDIVEARYVDMVGRCMREGGEFGVLHIEAGGETGAPPELALFDLLSQDKITRADREALAD